MNFSATVNGLHLGNLAKPHYHKFTLGYVKEFIAGVKNSKCMLQRINEKASGRYKRKITL